MSIEAIEKFKMLQEQKETLPTYLQKIFEKKDYQSHDLPCIAPVFPDSAGVGLR
jgi:hypothetical protein